MLCTDDSFDEGRVLMNFNGWKYKTHLCKSRSREEDFASKCCCQRAAKTASFRPALLVSNFYMATMSKRTNSAHSSSFSDPKFSIISSQG